MYIAYHISYIFIPRDSKHFISFYASYNATAKKFGVEMKKAVKKIFEKNEYYDDILGMVVTQNKFKIWTLRIGLLLVPILVMLILFKNLF